MVADAEILILYPVLVGGRTSELQSLSFSYKVWRSVWKLPSVKTDYYSTFLMKSPCFDFQSPAVISFKWQIKWYLPMITGCNTAMIKFFSGFPITANLPIHLTSSLQLFPWDSLLLADLRKGYAGFFCLTCLSPLDLSWPILPFSWGVCLMMLLRESSLHTAFPYHLLSFFMA